MKKTDHMRSAQTVDKAPIFSGYESLSDTIIVSFYKYLKDMSYTSVSSPPPSRKPAACEGQYCV
jgi:hypothetical protein